MSSPGTGESAGAGMSGADPQTDEVIHADFDALLHPNDLETLVNFDFSYEELSIPDSDVNNHPSGATSLFTNGRRQSFSQTCSTISRPDSGGAASSDVGAGLFAGVWEAATSMGSLDNFSASENSANELSTLCAEMVRCAPESNATPRRAGNSPLSRVPAVEHPVDHTSAHSSKGCKGRRTASAGAGSKRQLNPDRMERKASREKRRREEVNERFDQLLQVLETAEATSGLEPPPPAEGQAAGNACVNGRRVEVLSRTITVLKKLLNERSKSSSVFPEDSHHLGDDKAGDDAVASGLTKAKAGCVSTAGVAGVNAGAANASTQASHMQHFSLRLNGHTPLSMPTGFMGMPGMSIPPGVASAAGVSPGMSGQPLFIAVPVYMPPGQGVPSADNPGQASATMMPAPASNVAPEAGAGQKVGASAAGADAPTAKEWKIPPGVNFGSIMPLQMPQFVTQVLTADEGDEQPTHAVCA